MVILLACAPEEPAAAAAVPALTDVEVLTRVSLDLRGIRPGVVEIAMVEADPASLDGLIDDFLRDAGYGRQVRSLYADIYRTRYEHYYVLSSQYLYTDSAGFMEALGDEPLRILSEVADQDLPWTEIVTGDWTMADEVLGSLWPNDYDKDTQEGWARVNWTDGRPAAGVLASNTLWMRYYSTSANMNRGRANQVSRLFLCHDYLSREIDFDVAAATSTGAALEDALRSNPGCVSCHQSLDPIASYLFGFWWYDLPTAGESTEYHPERELLWQEYTGVAPAWYGEPGYTLSDLGNQVAADPRFPTCAVQQVFEGLLDREVVLDDFDALAAHREEFITKDLTMRALWRSVVDDPRYRADGTLPELQVDRKIAGPELMATQIEDLTGFVWDFAGSAMMGTDESGGVRTLAGGVDGFGVTRAAVEPGATFVLVQQRLAELAAGYALAQEGARPTEERRLFGEIDLGGSPPDEDALRTGLEYLHLRILSRHPTEEELDEDAALYSSMLDETGAAPVAWAGMATTYLRSPEWVLY